MKDFLIDKQFAGMTYDSTGRDKVFKFVFKNQTQYMIVKFDTKIHKESKLPDMYAKIKADMKL